MIYNSTLMWRKKVKKFIYLKKKTKEKREKKKKFDFCTHVHQEPNSGQQIQSLVSFRTTWLLGPPSNEGLKLIDCILCVTWKIKKKQEQSRNLNSGPFGLIIHTCLKAHVCTENTNLWCMAYSMVSHLKALHNYYNYVLSMYTCRVPYILVYKPTCCISRLPYFRRNKLYFYVTIV